MSIVAYIANVKWQIRKVQQEKLQENTTVKNFNEWALILINNNQINLRKAESKPELVLRWLKCYY